LANKRGQLVIIGGAEDRENEKSILSRVVELSGGKKADLVVLTTASRMAEKEPGVAEEFEQLYEGAFKDCGAGSVSTLHIFDRNDANHADLAERVLKASGIFMTGGDQGRLASILGGTEVGKAMHRAHKCNGAVIAGTSAGASAISEHMVGGGTFDLLPKKGMIPLAPGLGFLYRVIIDQHFSQRQRLGRLLSVLAQNPFLLAMGIDEDTALVVDPEKSVEVVGSGAVTLLDARKIAFTNINEVDRGEALALCNIQLNLLPSGFRYHLPDDEANDTAFDETLRTAIAPR
jgi:cyanophycinase